MHGCDLAHGRLLHVNVQRLRLVNEGTTVSSHLDDGALRDLPDSLVENLDLVRNVRDALDGSTLGNDAVLHVLGPETHVNKVLKQPRVDNLELSSEHTTGVDVRGVGLEALVVAKNLRGRGCRHGRNEQRIADTVLCDLLLQRGGVRINAVLQPYILDYLPYLRHLVGVEDAEEAQVEAQKKQLSQLRQEGVTIGAATTGGARFSTRLLAEGRGRGGFERLWDIGEIGLEIVRSSGQWMTNSSVDQ